MRLWFVVAIIAVGLIGLLYYSGESGQFYGSDTDNVVRALYLGLIGTAAAASLLGSGIKFSQASRNIAIWLAIIIAMAGGYQYRYELQDIASRLTAGLIPGSPISVTDVDGRRTVMIEKDSSGHFETLGSVNGQPVRFMVDTGATTTVLSERDARSVGYDVDTLTFNIPVSTANGMTRAARVTADEIRVGEVFRNRQPVYVAGPGQLGQSLLGMSFLSTLAGYNVRGDRMVLID
jgi:aspartyl protease family protein